MTGEEANNAVEAMRLQWPFATLDGPISAQYRRLFCGYPCAEVKGVLDDLRRRSLSMPPPSEMAELLRSFAKSAVTARVKQPEPWSPPADAVPAEKVSDVVAAIKSGDLAEVDRLTNSGIR